MRRVLIRRVIVRGGVVAALSCAAVLAVGGEAGATTVPEDTDPATEAAPPDPALAAAIEVFEGRMTEAGLENLGPQPELTADDVETDPATYETCAPEIREAMSTFDEIANAAVLDGPQASSDRFGPPAATDETEGATTTTDVLAGLLDGEDEVVATVHRLDDAQIEAVDGVIEVMGSPEFTECFETMMSAVPEFSDVSVPDLTDLSIPDLSELTIPDLTDMSIPDLSDLSIPDLADLSIPDLTDLSLPDLTDLSIPDLTDLSIPELSDLSIPEGAMEFDLAVEDDLGLGDRSARFELSFPGAMGLSVETVIVRVGDVLVTLGHSTFNLQDEPMAIDLVAEAEAVVDSL